MDCLDYFFEIIDRNIILTDLKGEIFDISQHFLSSLNMVKTDFLGINVLSIIKFEGIYDIDEILDDVSTSGNDDYNSNLKLHTNMFSQVKVNVRKSYHQNTECLLFIFKSLNHDITSNDIFWKVFHESPNLMLVSDFETGEIFEVNQSLLDNFGYQKSELIMVNINNFVKISNEQKNEIILKLEFDKQLKNFEIEINLRNNRKIICLCSIQIIDFNFKKCLLTTLVDISDFKNDKQKLSNTEILNKSLFEDSPIAIELYDSHGLLKSVNSACINLFGLTNYKELEAFNLFDDPNLTKEIKEKIRKGEHVRYEFDFDFDLVKKYNLYNTTKSGRIWIDVLISQISNQTGYVVQIQDISKIKNYINQINEQSAFQNCVFDALYNPVFHKNTEGVYTGINRAFEDFFGKQKEDIVGKTVFEINPPKLAEIYFSADKRIFYGIDKEQIYEAEVLSHSLGTRNVIFYKKPILNFNNEITGLVGSIVDITDKRKIERSLMESEDRYRAIFEGTNEGIVLAEAATGKLTFANKAFKKLFGFEKDDIRRFHFRDLHPTYHAKDSESNFKSVPRTEKRIISNVPCQKADGTIFYCDVKDSKVDINGKQYNIGFFTDITSRKNQEQTLNLIAQNISGAIFQFEITGNNQLNFTYISDGVKDLFGIESEHFISYKDILFEIIYPEDLKKIVESLKSSNSLNLQWKDEFRILNQKNEISWIEVIASPSVNSDKKVIWHGYFHDISDRKLNESEFKEIFDELVFSREIIESNLFQKNELIEQLEEIKLQLEKVINEKDRFFSIIAHDLKSPFSSFMKLTKLIHDEFDNLSKDEINEIIDAIKNSSENLYKLLENLLEWSRVQQGFIKFNPDYVNIKYLINNLIEIYKDWLKNKNIKLNLQINYNGDAFADANMVSTMLRNFLSNAIKFTKPDGEITIQVNEVNNNQIIISVIDTGVGISEENIEKLFRVDSKVHSIGTEGEPSTGLGLILCDEYARLHDTKIIVDSTINLGSKFSFTLKKQERKIHY